MAERKPFRLGFSPAAYNRAGLRAIAAMDPKALEREYSRLRRDALDRIRGFERSSELRNKPFVKDKKRTYKTLKNIKSQAELETLIIDAARFVSARISSVSGYKAVRMDRVRSLRAAGYTWINSKNVEAFGQFMEWARANHSDRLYGSSRVAESFEKVVSGKISIEDLWANFEYYASAMS